ncbi:uncharacterized protein LOC131875240 [Cryptomeria japonica]|uniref:uncharacterized protein LOC131875240 n=1 Tax=Cryptomeria japonica TaxID=3369 RepID=UPI0027DA75C2|nr:uncharacterized protein LOC131875240 [Cryptomeria japonica]
MRVWKQCNGFFRKSDGASSGLGFIWNPMNVKISLMREDKYWQHCLVTILGHNESLNIFNMYGPSSAGDKQALWDLQSIKLNSITDGMTKDLFIKENSLKLDLNEILRCEEIHWQQKSRELWLKEGDKKTKFFQRSAIANRNRNRILEIMRSDGITVKNYEDIAHEVVRLFDSLLNGDHQIDHEARAIILNSIPSTISSNQNTALCTPISIDEVRKTTFHLKPDKTPGPDNFPIALFHHY